MLSWQYSEYRFLLAYTATIRGTKQYKGQAQAQAETTHYYLSKQGLSSYQSESNSTVSTSAGEHMGGAISNHCASLTPTVSENI